MGLPQPEGDKIRRNYRNPTQRKEAYLDLYVYHHYHPTWRKVGGVLQIFKLTKQADLVENTYVKGTQDTLKLDSWLHVYNRKPCANYIMSKTHPPVYIDDL